MKYLILLVLLAGCGQGSNIDPQLQPYVDSFVQAGNLTIVTPMNIQFGSVPDVNEQGQCTEGGLGAFTITIDSTAWSTFDETDKTLLMYHELGHCVLGLQHDLNKLANGFPESIMYPMATAAHDAYRENSATYLNQLFTQSQ